ncbi:MAG TPA: helix-turn-helix domain-containing protein [Gemmataceae bacterium]|nr:helix-turn-helix domain-containing protein [Gemmataceae bacterium]
MKLRTSNDPFPTDPVTVCEAAALVRVSRKTISRRLAQGKLRCWVERTSGRIRLSRADVLALFEARVPAGFRPPRPPKPSGKREQEKAAALARVRAKLGRPPDEWPPAPPP